MSKDLQVLGLSSISRIVLPIKSNFAENGIQFAFDLNLFLDNDSKMIVFWYPMFKTASIDLCSTPSWFEKNTTLFKRRNELFNYLNGELQKSNIHKTFIQQKRELKRSKNVILLEETEIKIINEWFFKQSGKFTFNSISGIFSGYNPAGKIKIPKSAEMMIDSKDDNLLNYFISNIIDAISVRNYFNWYKKWKSDLNDLYIEKTTLFEFIIQKVDEKDKKAHIYKSLLNSFKEADYENRAEKIKVCVQDFYKNIFLVNERTKLQQKLDKEILKKRQLVSKHNPLIFHNEWKIIDLKELTYIL